MSATRRRIAVVAALTLAIGGLTALPASAAPVSATHDGVEYTADDSDVGAGAHVTAFDDSTTTVDIPDTVQIGGTAFDVVAIDDEVFKAASLTSAVIGDNVTTIGEMAFGQNALTSLTLGNSVTTIGEDAFQNNQLTALNLPGSLITIGDDAFTYNELASLTLPDSVTTVGGGAFSNNELASLTLSNSLTTIETYAFTGNKLTSLTLPDSVIAIDAYAFRHNELASLTLSNSLTTIGYGSFMDNQLTSVTVPASVTNIKGHAFDSNPGLVSVFFNGPPPAPAPLVAANESAASFDTSSGSLLLTYAWRYGDPQTPGGFTSPTYRGYDTQAVATVDFDLNGQPGTPPTDEDIAVGGIATEPIEPTASGYTFNGWFTDAGATVPFDFTTPITEDTTLFGGWEEVADVPPADIVTVTKTVNATFVRVHDWDLAKTGQVGGVTVGTNSASAEVNYTVTATPGDYRDDYYMLTGQITVTNETVESLPFTITDTPNVGADATCQVLTADGDPAEDVTIDGNETVTFDYTCALDGIPADGTNTATVSWFNGEDAASVTQDVVFEQRAASFDTVTVVDDQTIPEQGWETLGTAEWNAEGIATEFKYTLAHDDLVIGECTSLTNTAMINETEQTVEETVELCPEAGAAPVPTEPNIEIDTALTPTLPQTGADVKGGTIAALLLLIAGSIALTVRRRQQI